MEGSSALEQYMDSDILTPTRCPLLGTELMISFWICSLFSWKVFSVTYLWSWELEHCDSYTMSIIRNKVNDDLVNIDIVVHMSLLSYLLVVEYCGKEKDHNWGKKTNRYIKIAFSENNVFSYLEKMSTFWKTVWIPLLHPDLKKIPQLQNYSIKS